MGVLIDTMEKNNKKIVEEIEKINKTIEKKETKKQNKNVLMRQLKNDVMHQMAEDLKSNVNLFQERLCREKIR